MISRLNSIHDASRLSWGKFPGCEASDLHGQPLFTQLYDDACDLGFGLRNGHSGGVTYWYVSSEDKLGGEIQGWRMKACSESIRRHPALGGMELLIVND